VPAHGKVAGKSIKGPDNEALSLCTFCHSGEHEKPMKFWHLINISTGKTREQWVKETWERYQQERGE